TDDVLARVHREEHSRLLATLVRRFGDLDLAEDAAQEAMEGALRSWPEQGVPQQPLAWLTTAATRAALDRVRRDATYARRRAARRRGRAHRGGPPGRASRDADGLLPSRDRARGQDRADAAVRRLAEHRRGRAGAAGPGAHSAGTDHPGEEADLLRPDPPGGA